MISFQVYTVLHTWWTRQGAIPCGARIVVSSFQKELDLLRWSWFRCRRFRCRRFLAPLRGSGLRLCKVVHATKFLQVCMRSKQTFLLVFCGAVFLLELIATAPVGLAAGFFAAESKVAFRRQ